MTNRLPLVGLAAMALGLVPTLAHADTYFECRAVQVLEYSNRVHVKCDNTIQLGSDSVQYFAIAKSDEDRVKRFINLGSAAVLSGQIFWVLAPTSSANNVPSCGATNCRTPGAFGLRNGN